MSNYLAMYSKLLSLLSIGFLSTLNAEIETTYVTVASEAAGVHTNDIMRFLDISYSTEATDLYNDPDYTFIGYRFSWGSGDYVLFSFDDSNDDLQLLGDKLNLKCWTFALVKCPTLQLRLPQTYQPPTNE